MLEPPNIPSRRPAKQNAIQILTGSSPAVHLASPRLAFGRQLFLGAAVWGWWGCTGRGL